MRLVVIAFVALAALVLETGTAHACGGFFCNQQPVDQQAERILFALGPTGTTMIVQIAYTGAPEDFAWILPVADVPDRESLGTFPAAAIQALDVNTAPMFFRPMEEGCYELLLNGGGSDASTPGVTVHIDEIVGPYEVAVIEAATAEPVFQWLADNDYQVGAAMRPVIASYVADGMKILALRLGPNSGTSDIEPFRMTLPPGPPSIPIRLTAIAAEPEMGFLVFLFADQRWGPANWSELEIDPATLRWASHAWPSETDWLRRVAVDADADGGRAWVTEMAGPTAPLLETVRAAVPSDPDQVEARDALLDLLGAHPYMTRLYARLSPDEMTIDPIFRARGGDDVPRERQLARIVDGVDLCAMGDRDPCLFSTCGPGASCALVRTEAPDARVRLPGCGCTDGTSARATVDPSGQVVAVCQRLTSFLTPAEIGMDPCTGIDCGAGTCVPINATPTCTCDAGSVAIGFVREGVRQTLCVDPALVVAREVIGMVEPRLPDGGPPVPDGGPPPPVVGGGGCACAVADRDRSPLPPAVLSTLLALLVMARTRSRRWRSKRARPTQR